MRLSWLVFLLVLFVSSQENKGERQNCVWPCPEGWEENENHCFFFQDPKKSWEDAEKQCKNYGGHLASVTSQKIHYYLLSKVKQTQLPYWVGGADKMEEGKWLWSDGNPWNFTLWATRPHQQPDNDGAGENCLEINDGGTPGGWNDDNCEREQNFICNQRICQNLTALRNDASSADVVDVTILAIVLSSGLILILIVALTIGFLVCNSSKTTKEETMDVDENHVYGVYQLGNLYERQYSTNEVTDNNDYYG